MRCDRMPELDRDKVRKDFAEAVNMTASELKKWLATKESRAVGWKGKDGKGSGESVGHASGRRIVAILGKTKAELTDDDYRPHAQGRRLRSPPSRAGAGQHRHVALALFAHELGQRSVEKLGLAEQHRLETVAYPNKPRRTEREIRHEARLLRRYRQADDRQ